MGHQEWARIQHSSLDDLDDTLKRNMQEYGMDIIKGALSKLCLSLFGFTPELGLVLDTFPQFFKHVCICSGCM